MVEQIEELRPKLQTVPLGAEGHVLHQREVEVAECPGRSGCCGRRCRTGPVAGVAKAQGLNQLPRLRAPRRRPVRPGDSSTWQAGSGLADHRAGLEGVGDQIRPVGDAEGGDGGAGLRGTPS